MLKTLKTVNNNINHKIANKCSQNEPKNNHNYLSKYKSQKTGISYIIRLARPNDIPSIHNIERKAYHIDICDELEYFEKRFKYFPEGMFVLVDENDINILGFFCGEIWTKPENIENLENTRNIFRIDHSIENALNRNGNFLYIANWSLHPQMRGSGIGQVFFTECRKALKNMYPNINSEGLIVSDKWENAQHIYRKQGFRNYVVLDNFFIYNDEKPNEAAIVMFKNF